MVLFEFRFWVFWCFCYECSSIYIIIFKSGFWVFRRNLCMLHVILEEFDTHFSHIFNRIFFLYAASAFVCVLFEFNFVFNGHSLV